MKKLLSILVTIGLTTTIAISLISCEKPNNNENLNNKPEIIPEPKKSQQPPENSNWKLVDNIFNIDTLNNDAKVYIGIFEDKIENKPKWNIISWKNIIGEQKLWLHFYKSIYYWDDSDEPELPTINKNTGKITNWK